MLPFTILENPAQYKDLIIIDNLWKQLEFTNGKRLLRSNESRRALYYPKTIIFRCLDELDQYCTVYDYFILLQIIYELACVPETD